MLSRILLPLDGSPRAERAIPLVETLAQAFGADVILVRVVEGESASLNRWTDPVHWRLERAEATTYLEGVGARLREAGVHVDLDVGVGRPAEEILEITRARRVELLVLTSHGLGDATGVHLAGTAHKVLAGAETSVLLVPVDADEVHPGERPTRIVVPVDGSPRGEWAVGLAAIVARFSGARLEVAFVIQEPEAPRGRSGERVRALAKQFVDASRDCAREYLVALVDRLSASDLKIFTRVETASGGGCRLGQRLASQGSDTLLVLGCCMGTDQGHLYGIASAALSEGCGSPLLLLRTAPLPDPSPLKPVPARSRWSTRRRPASTE